MEDSTAPTSKLSNTSSPLPCISHTEARPCTPSFAAGSCSQPPRECRMWNPHPLPCIPSARWRAVPEAFHDPMSRSHPWGTLPSAPQRHCYPTVTQIGVTHPVTTGSSTDISRMDQTHLKGWGTSYHATVRSTPFHPPRYAAPSRQASRRLLPVNPPQQPSASKTESHSRKAQLPVPHKPLAWNPGPIGARAVTSASVTQLCGRKTNFVRRRGNIRAETEPQSGGHRRTSACAPVARLGCTGEPRLPRFLSIISILYRQGTKNTKS